jgi:UDP-glucose 4-epimerase
MSEHLGQRSLNATHLVKVCCEVALGMRPHLEIFGNDYPTRDGTGVRDYIHVQDLVEAHLLALDRLHSALDLSKNEATLRSANKPFDIFNVGYGRGYSVREVVQTFNEICGKQIFVVDRPRRAGDVAEVVADVQKIQHELGFLPQKNSLNKICKDALDWEKHLRGR